MADSVQFITGPLVSEFTREAAEAGLRQNKKFGPKIASGEAAYALDKVEGRWVAAIVVEADSPFGGPADQEEQAPGPKSEGPNDTAPEPVSDDPTQEDGPPSDDSSSEGGDSEGDKSKDKGSEKHELSQVIDALTQIGQALGIPLNLGDPGMGDPNDPSAGGPPGAGAIPPPPGPPGMGGPPGAGGPPGPGGPGDTQHIIHEKALKPGEVPPGGTPIGAPAFSHVRNDHPWKHVAGKIASIPTENPIGDRPMSDVHAELVSLASELGGGYRVAKLEEATDNSGQRIARAVISIH